MASYKVGDIGASLFSNKAVELVNDLFAKSAGSSAIRDLPIPKAEPVVKKGKDKKAARQDKQAKADAAEKTSADDTTPKKSLKRNADSQDTKATNEDTNEEKPKDTLRQQQRKK